MHHPTHRTVRTTVLCYTRYEALSVTRNSSREREREREREMFYLTTHSTHFIYGYMASDIWLRTILIVRKETRCRHIGYSYRLTARVLLYALFIGSITHTTAFVTPVVENWLEREIAQWVHHMKDRSTTHRTMSERSTSELRPAPQIAQRVHHEGSIRQPMSGRSTFIKE